MSYTKIQFYLELVQNAVNGLKGRIMASTIVAVSFVKE